MPEKKDANVDQDLTLREEIEKAETEVDTETSEESSTQEETEQQETPEEGAEETEETEEKSEEDTALEDLDNDEEFLESKKELETELGKELTFNQTKRFRKTYWKMREGEREKQRLADQLTELQNKELSDNELLGEAMKRGILDQEKTPPAEKEEFDFDKLYASASNEQRKWLDIFKNVVGNETRDLRNQVKEYEDKFGKIELTQQQKEIAAEEQRVAQEVKEKYDLNYEKDILPEMQVVAQRVAKNLRPGMSLAEAGWTTEMLVNQVLAEKHVEFSKKKLAAETKKLNTVKKKANIETDSVQGVPDAKPDDDKSLRDIYNEEVDNEGLSKFE